LERYLAFPHFSFGNTPLFIVLYRKKQVQAFFLESRYSILEIKKAISKKVHFRAAAIDAGERERGFGSPFSANSKSNRL
jgi:plasmid maintenance system killer protein